MNNEKYIEIAAEVELLSLEHKRKLLIFLRILTEIEYTPQLPEAYLQADSSIDE